MIINIITKLYETLRVYNKVIRVYSFKPIPFSEAFFFGMFILFTHSSENAKQKVSETIKRSNISGYLLANLLFFLKTLGFSEFILC